VAHDLRPAAADGAELAAEVIARLAAREVTVAVAESLTGGLLAAALTSVPGASVVVRGGVVAYSTDLKATLLGVDPGLLDRVGPVDPDVAAAMARGVRTALAASYGVATTGEAGPDSATGHPVGTVHVAVSGPGGDEVASVVVGGDRAAVRGAAVVAALGLLDGVLA
jgi:nicotinamide-nucleotide amidase